MVRHIRPEDVAPLINPNIAAHVAGTQVHRRVLTPGRGGPDAFDLGYTTFEDKLLVTQRYAYTIDEFCYLPFGNFVAESDGEVVETQPGSVMWRPAGAVTDRVEIVGAAVSLCAFAPARQDDWSHKLPDEDVGKWDGPGPRPRVQFFTPDQSEEVTLTGTGGKGVMHRLLPRSVRQQRGFAIDLIHIEKNARATLPHAAESILWVQDGAIAHADGEKEVRADGKDFMHFSVWDRAADISALETSTLVRFASVSEPAGNDR